MANPDAVENRPSGLPRQFKSRRLRRFWEKGEKGAIDAAWRETLRDQLSALFSASDTETMRRLMNAPGWHFEDLRGDRQGSYSVWVTVNWRLVWRFEDGYAYEIDLVDYHRGRGRRR